MKLPAWALLPALLLTACSHTYYVVRHAEKAPATSMTSDVPLSPAGQDRAAALKNTLKGKHIVYIYSTNTTRTLETVKPTAEYIHRLVQIYGPVPDSAFMARLKSLHRNTLIVGHSNTVDDIVNGLTGERSIPGDLADSEYDNLFKITVKGKKVRLERLKYGKSN